MRIYCYYYQDTAFDFYAAQLRQQWSVTAVISIDYPLSSNFVVRFCCVLYGYISNRTMIWTRILNNSRNAQIAVDWLHRPRHRRLKLKGTRARATCRIQASEMHCVRSGSLRQINLGGQGQIRAPRHRAFSSTIVDYVTFPVTMIYKMSRI